MNASKGGGDRKEGITTAKLCPSMSNDENRNKLWKRCEGRKGRHDRKEGAKRTERRMLDRWKIFHKQVTDKIMNVTGHD